jgi:ureidoglycolate dehydrogenase (NAD+)
MDAAPDIRIAAADLQTFIARIFAKAGFSPADAAVLAEVLTWANLRGIDSHGALRVPSYLGFVAKGQMNPQAVPRVTVDLPAAVMIEGDRAAGPVAMLLGTDHAIAKAKAAGICLAQVRRTTHTGPIGYYGLRAAEAGMAAIVLSASTPNMAYHGARKAGVANSPLAIAVPAAGRPPIVLDMATSVAANGKLMQAKDAGLSIPEGWALTEDGRPATDPAQAEVLLPLGGAKGSGLALLIECVTSLMVANPLLEAIVAGREKRGHKQNSLIIAIDIAAFTDTGAFAESASALATAIKALPRANEREEILMPGERGAASEAERRKNGIPLARGTWTKLEAVAKEKGVALPQLMT